MPDDKTLTPPGIDKLTKGGLNAETGRSKKINSLSNTINKAVQNQDKNRVDISKQIDSMRQQNLQNMKDFDISNQDFTTQTAAGYNRVLKGLGDTIQSLSMGVRNITAGTAKAGADLVKQYGKAISEDISVNKQNTVVMALAKTTPLFGYFAAKFMETDVFKNAASRMKESITKGLSGVGEFLTQDINIFKKKEKMASAQHGGLVTKEGVVKVHAAEIIAPVDKVADMVKGIAESKLVKTLDKVVLSLDATLEKFRESISAAAGTGKPGAPKGGPFQTFMTAYAKRDNEFRLPWQERVADELTRIRVASSGLVSKMEDAWIRTLAEHPGLRGMMQVGKAIKGAFKLASGLLFFTPSGKYAKDISKATKPKSAFDKTVNILSLIYTKTQPKLDLMLHHLRILSKAEDPIRKRGMFEATLGGLFTAGGKMAAAPFRLAAMAAGGLGRMAGRSHKKLWQDYGSVEEEEKTKPSRGRTGKQSTREIEIGRLKMEKKNTKYSEKRNKILETIKKNTRPRKIWDFLKLAFGTMSSLFGKIPGLLTDAVFAALVGWVAGKAINKWLVDPILKAILSKSDEERKKSQKQTISQGELYRKQLKEGNLTPEQRAKRITFFQEQTGLAATKELRTGGGGWRGALKSSYGPISDFFGDHEAIERGQTEKI